MPITIDQFVKGIEQLRAEHRARVAKQEPTQFAESDLKFAIRVCEALQHPSFGAAGQWLKFHAPEAFIESVDAENDTINAPCFSIQVVTDFEEYLGVKRGVDTYHVSVPVTIPGGHWEPDDVDLREIGDATSLGNALYLVYQYACEQVFNDAMHALDHTTELSIDNGEQA